MERGSTWFCPDCWQEVNPEERICPACGSDLGKHKRADYEAELIRALEHRMADRRLIASRVLGQIGGTRAVRALIKLVERGDDPYAAAEAVRALARIGGHQASEYLKKANAHPSAVVRHAARKATSA
jgi:HEAT repeat protein